MSHEAPLFSKQVLITREAKQAKSFAQKIEKLGGIPVTIPVLTFEKTKNIKQMMEALQQLQFCDWLVFTSQNGIEFFFQWLDVLQIKKEVVSKLKIAVVGEKTNKVVQRFGFTAQLLPEQYVAESLRDALLKVVGLQERIFIVRGNLARDVIQDGLRAKGYDVIDLVVYETVKDHKAREQLRSKLQAGEIDAITFTSSSTVDFFVEAVKDHSDWLDWVNRTVVVCIGPITSKSAAAYGIKHLMPTIYTVDGMIEVLTNHFLEE
ncbi:uroporphyrinogen-III synthase [Priestia megaterium]|nr:uroporphyrinogen-III synthase [Priestia megaterium]